MANDVQIYRTARKLAWADVKQLVDKPAPLWTNNDSTYYGRNDRVKVDIAAKLSNSLMLIEPEDLTTKVVTEGAEFGNPRRRVRADFKHLGTYYSLVVTDPVAEGGTACKVKRGVQDEKHLSVYQFG